MKAVRYGVALCVLVLLSARAHGNDQVADPGAALLEEALDAVLHPRTDDSGVWDFSVGADYSSGAYGAARATRVYYAPFGVGYRSGRWRAALDSGLLRVKGPVDYASILDLAPEDVADLGLEDDVAASGLADTTVSAAYTLYENFDHLLFVDVGARVKVPTARRSKGLGNGRLAADLQLDIIKVAGPWSVMASAAYGFRPRDRASRDTPSFSLGLGRNLAETTTAGMIFEWRRSVDPRAKDGRDVMAYLTHRIDDTVSLMAYGVRSLISTGVDIQAGLRVTYRWDRGR